MRKLLIAICAVFALVACDDAPKNPTNKPVIKIGAVLPLSGDFANVGNSFKNAMTMALADVRKTDTKYHYELVVDDSGFETKKDALLFNKQAHTDKVSAMVSFASASGNVIAPLAQANKIIYLNVGASDPVVAAGDYNFIHWTPSDVTAQRVVDFYKSRGWDNIVFLGSIDAGVEKIESEFTKLAHAAGMKTRAFYANGNEKDLRVIIRQAADEKPDAFMIMFWGGQLPVFVKQYHEAGLNIPLTNIETFAMAPDFDIIEGAYFSDVAQNSDEFNERLHDEYPKTQNDFATGNYYDAIMLIVRAFESADVPEDAVAELQKIKTYTGIVGKLEQDKIGIFRSGAVMKQIKNGKAELIK
ncbi:MAG: ABC transporter substrate-binding protein [Rickettsiales bacterium]|jgi:branched-chain amino acid transport system substrate-binding protein|nr:ABC transporter substrate-binding protein [Rickettsiales bacterium]